MRTSADLSAGRHRTLRLLPSNPPQGEVCVLLDPDRAVVWLHGAIDASLSDDLVDAATDLVEAGLPVILQAGGTTSCDGTVLELIGRLLAGGLSLRIVDPRGHLTRAVQDAVRPAGYGARGRSGPLGRDAAHHGMVTNGDE